MIGARQRYRQLLVCRKGPLPDRVTGTMKFTETKENDVYSGSSGRKDQRIR